MTVLIVDNYDSFTWNLVQLFGALGARPVVSRNDQITLSQVRALGPTHIVLSPGPGNPHDAHRIGVCRDILEALTDVPVLGVCLGHQAMVSVLGGRVIRAEQPMHGKTSLVHHDGSTLYEGIAQPFLAMRYHSLIADPSTLPAVLRPTAWCADQTIMAIEHVTQPWFGVQFHPESVATPAGPLIARNFLRISGKSAR